VAGESRFLRRDGASALDRRQVLRKDDPPLELRRPRVCAFSEIDHPALGPETTPMPFGKIDDLGKTRQLLPVRKRRKADDTGKLLCGADGLNHKGMWARPPKAGAVR